MKRSMQIRVTPNMYYLLEAIRLLMSNDRGFNCSQVSASEKAFELFMEFANFDLTKGNKIMEEFKKVRRNFKIGVTQTAT